MTGPSDIIIGAGAGGGTLAYKLKLAPTGKRMLLPERGDFLPREKENWSSVAVGRYRHRGAITTYRRER